MLALLWSIKHYNRRQLELRATIHECIFSNEKNAKKVAYLFSAGPYSGDSAFKDVPTNDISCNQS